MRRGIAPILLLALFLTIALSRSAQSAPVSRIVELKANDGTALKATFFPASSPGPGVILLHQCNRQRKVWDDLANSLATSGINVLTLDFRGFGDSAGTPLDKLTPQQATKEMDDVWPSDVDIALHYLESQPGVNREFIGAGGASCGVNQAVHLAQRHPEVKSLTLLSESTDHDGRAFLRKSPNLPLLLAVADDDPDPGVVDLMQWLDDLSPNTSNKFVHYSTGGHGVEMFAAHKELPAVIVEWFHMTLKSPSSAPADRAADGISPESRFLELTDQPDGVKKAVAMFEEARQHDPKAAVFSEVIVNRIGYERLLAGDNQSGIALMKLNTEAYPDSPNAYDSLGDAYAADGQKDLARQSAQKAIDLLAADTKDSAQQRDAIKANAELKLK